MSENTNIAVWESENGTFNYNVTCPCCGIIRAVGDNIKTKEIALGLAEKHFNQLIKLPEYEFTVEEIQERVKKLNIDCQDDVDKQILHLLTDQLFDRLRFREYVDFMKSL